MLFMEAGSNGTYGVRIRSDGVLVRQRLKSENVHAVSRRFGRTFDLFTE